MIINLKSLYSKYLNKNLNKLEILYLSILYLDIILSKNKISLSHDKNLKYLCLCCFLLSLKFIGNYDTSKKIISNFCRNYKHEYRIFEIQCLMLLEHKLVYTTAYNFLSMILINEPKNLISICNSILYQICEENIYTFYSPFYISVAIFQMAKNSINYNNHNHYDKYFNDGRVKYLIKKFNYSINPPSLKIPFTNKNNINDDIKNNLNNTISNTNVNIITNNHIQNNIVIINTISKKKSDNNFNKNYSFYVNNNSPKKINYKRNFIKKNNEMINKNNNTNNYNPNNTLRKIIRKYKNYGNSNEKQTTISNSKITNILSSSHFKIFRINNLNSNTNNHKTITIKDTNKKRSNFRINSFLQSSNCLSKPTNKIIEHNSFDLKKKCNYKEESLSTEIQTPNQLSNKNINEGKSKIFANKSSLNFQLVSGVPKEKLVKLSRNLSKTMVNESLQNDKVNK